MSNDALQQSFRWDRRPAHLRIHPVELPRQTLQGFVRHCFDGLEGGGPSALAPLCPPMPASYPEGHVSRAWPPRKEQVKVVVDRSHVSRAWPPHLHPLVALSYLTDSIFPQPANVSSRFDGLRTAAEEGTQTLESGVLPEHFGQRPRTPQGGQRPQLARHGQGPSAWTPSSSSGGARALSRAGERGTRFSASRAGCPAAWKSSSARASR